MIAEAIRWLARRSLENPSTDLSDPDEWFYDAMGGGPTASGVRVNKAKALTYSVVWRALMMLSGDLAKLHRYVMARDGQAKRRATEHPAYSLLLRKPNEYMTAHTMACAMVGHVLLQGNAFAYIQRDGAGRPIALLLLDPAETYCLRKGGVFSYVTTINVNGRPVDKAIAAADMLHYKRPGYDGLSGYSALEYGREPIALALAAQDHGARFFSNSLEPSSVVEVPARMSDAAYKRLRASWGEIHGGLENKHKMALLEEGAKIHPFSLSAKDAQLLESREFSIRDVANLFGIPPTRLGDNTKTSYASLEQENLAYLDSALDPLLVAFETEDEAKLLTEDEQAADTHSVEFDRRALLRADRKTLAEYNRVALGGQPWLTIDEVRNDEGLNPLPDGAGAVFRVPLNVTDQQAPANGQDEEDGTEPPPNDQPDDMRARAVEAMRIVTVDALRQIGKRLAVHSDKAAKSGAAQFGQWCDSGLDEHRGAVARMLAPSIAGLHTVGGDGKTAEVVADLVISDWRERMLTAAECQPDELADHVRAAGDVFARSGAEEFFASNLAGGLCGTEV